MKNQNIENIYPLTSLQEGMLFHALRMEDHFVYMEQMSMTLNAPLDEKRIEESFQLLAQKYDVLRASIVYEKTPRPLHVIKKKIEIPIQVHNLQEIEAEDVDAAIQRIKDEDYSQGFDFKKGPLFRLNYINISKEKSILVFTFHHIIIDGWSVAIIIKDFYDFYTILLENKTPKITQVTQFNEYIKLQESTDKGKALKYWKDYLSGYETLASFSNKTDKSSNFTYTIQKFHLSTEAQLGIEELMNQFDITFPLAMQFLWGIMLARLSLNDDVVFGTIVSGRSVDLEQIESMVGMTINTIPVRLRFDKSNLKEKLVNFIETSLDALSYQNSSLSDIQNQTGLTELFNQLLVFENYPYEELDSSDALKVLEIDVLEKTNYRFLVNITYGSKIMVKICYDPLTYSEKIIAQVSEIINYLATNIPNKLETYSLQNIPLIPEHIKSEVDAFNNTDTVFPKETLVSLFAKGLEATPNHIAVTDEYRTWTWKELDQYSTVIAAQLLSRGIEKEESVCLQLERSNFMMAALLGVLKAGGAYVPIDSSIPEKRKAFIMKNSSARYLILENNTNIEFNWVENENCIVLDDLDYTKELEVDLPLIQPKNLAYIIYTSGSTGQPKGVMIEHQSINNRLQWMQKEYPVKETDRLIQKTNYAFDVSVSELFGWMFSGASLHFLKQGGEKDPSVIFDNLVSKEITRVHFVPSVYAVFLEYCSAFEDIKKLHKIDYFFSSGERLGKDIIQKFNILIHSNINARLINLYGPTEAAVEVTSYLCPLENVPEQVPIGKPTANCKMYVLDEHLNELPIGYSGGIYIEGIQVARGYINDEKLTKKVFFKSPFNTERRMYNSGDIGRWNSEGNIEFLDRKDGQIKLRGYRIELDEIIWSMKSFEGVNQCTVSIHDENIIGFYAGKKVASEDLEAHMNSILPAYMVPNQFKYIEKWPVTVNGKTDTKSLKQHLIRTENSNSLEKVEEGILANIWKSLLKVEKIHANDDFFALGGHSLLAIRLIAQIQKKFSAEINIKDIFYHSKFNEVQNLIATKEAIIQNEIKVHTTDEDIPLTGAQKRIFVLYNLLDKDATYHIPSVWQLESSLDKKKLNDALTQVVNRHSILRTGFIFDEENGVFKQEISENIDVQIEWETKNIPLEEIENYCEDQLKNFVKPFELASTPLFRMKVVSLSEKEHFLFFDVHHIIFDGPSFQIFFKDLLDYYKGESLAPLKIQFKDFAYHSQQKLEEEKAKISKEFWIHQFKKGIPLLNFKAANKRVLAKDKKGKVIKAEIAFDQKKKLQALAQKLNLTLNQLLFGTYVLLLMKKSKQHDIVVGTTVNTRDTEEAIPLIGMFANTVAIPFYHEKDWNLIRFFEYIKEQLVGALTHKEYPFDQLVNDLNIDRDVTRSPLFDVMYSMETGLEQENFGGHSLSPIQLKEKPVSFDISFFVNEYADHIKIYLEYDTHLFSDEWSENLLASWIELVDEVSNQLNENLFEFCRLPSQKSYLDINKAEKNEQVTSTDTIVKACDNQATILSNVWKKLLDKKPVSGNEDFFKEGGHSILAVRLSLLLFKETGIKVPLIQIFAAPSFHQILSYLKKEVANSIDDIKTIEDAPYYELSEAQKRMWITHELGTQKHAYNLTITYKITGDVAIEKLKRSFNTILQEQEVFRSYYQLVEGVPKMYIQKDLVVDWDEKDVSMFSNPDEEAYQICQTKFSEGFDLEKPPLFRIGLYKTGENIYWISLISHHILIDGWSLRLFMEQLLDYYERDVIPENKTLQYRDFAHWQNERLKGAFGKKLHQYWEKRFQQPLQIPKLKSKRVELSVGETKLAFFSRETFQTITKISDSYGCSNYQFLFGTFGAVLCHIRKSEEQLILFSDAGRVHPKLEKIIGFFINTLPFRYELQHEESVQEMIKRIRNQILSDIEHAELPLHDILQKIKSNGAPKRQLLNTRLVYNDFDYGAQLKMKGIEAEEQRIDSDAGKFDLSIAISPLNDELSVQMEYDTSVYTDDDIEKLLETWKELITKIGENPNITVGDALQKVYKKQSASSMMMSLNALKNMQVETIKMEENES